MQPDHHRAFLVIVNPWRPNVRTQTVLASNPVIPTEEPGLFIIRPTCAGDLRADLAVLPRTSHTRPGLGFCRRQKARFATDRRGVGHSFESENTVADVTADFSRRGFDDGFSASCRNNRRAAIDGSFRFRNDRGWQQRAASQTRRAFQQGSPAKLRRFQVLISSAHNWSLSNQSRLIVCVSISYAINNHPLGRSPYENSPPSSCECTFYEVDIG